MKEGIPFGKGLFVMQAGTSFLMAFTFSKAGRRARELPCVILMIGKGNDDKRAQG